VKFRNLTVAGASALALISAGCGSGGSTTPSANVPVVAFGSPALAGSRVIPARFKCNNRDVWLPLQWGELPANTQELAMYIARFGSIKQVEGKVTAEVKASAVIVGIKPSLRKLSLGKYPPGVLVGIHAPNNANASICPPKGTRQNLMFRIYALPHKLGVSKASHDEGENLVNTMRSQAIGAGTFIVSYKPA
jgi:phosphatidylethanolamine-binding protein (PEBP) family uncharacterized protein